MKFFIAVVITCSFLFAWDKSFSQELTTGNLLSNSGFTGGTTSMVLV